MTTFTRAFLLALTAWNAANARASREYALHPNAACLVDNCPNLAPSAICGGHARLGYKVRRVA